jgi:TPR repeat protein
MDINNIELQAASGDSEAQYQLGLMHLYGRNVKLDSHKGFDMLQASAQQGYAKAATLVSILYYKGFVGADHFIKDRINIQVKPSEAYRYCLAAAQAGLRLAQERLYKIMLAYPEVSGLTEHENTGQALHWLKTAADQQLESAQAELLSISVACMQQGRPIHQLKRYTSQG